MIDFALALRLAKASSAAYEQDPAVANGQMSVLGYPTVLHFDHPIAHALLAFGDKDAIVATRGTEFSPSDRISFGERLRDLLINGSPGLTPAPQGGMHHAGYGDAAEILWGQIRQVIDGRQIKVRWTGHSMGGVVTECMLPMAMSGWDHQSQFGATFGAPKPGDTEFCSRPYPFQDLTRVVREKDPAPLWPLADRFQQINGEAWLHGGVCDLVQSRPGFNDVIGDHWIEGYIADLEKLAA
jgi:Lipase (class 3)